MSNKDKWMKCAIKLLNYIAENPDQATKLVGSKQIKILEESFAKLQISEMHRGYYAVTAANKLAAEESKANRPLYEELHSIIQRLTNLLPQIERNGAVTTNAINALKDVKGYSDYEKTIS